ncbi:hypothetical protein SAMN02799624_00174 [Paenibacillus sp. UNC496MF]|nr:hypothetical protein SAMN02799624_00174 [Paenibacillus sp. UNC496MF]
MGVSPSTVRATLPGSEVRSGMFSRRPDRDSLLRVTQNRSHVFNYKILYKIMAFCQVMTSVRAHVNGNIDATQELKPKSY